MSKKPAKGVRGFLLHNPITDRCWFRVYDEADRTKFTDYRLAAEDIKVTVESGGLVLIDDEAGRRIDYDMEEIRRKSREARERADNNE
jgi:hypothetical protein